MPSLPKTPVCHRRRCPPACGRYNNLDYIDWSSILKIIPISRKADVAAVFSDFQGKLILLEDVDTPTMDEWEET